MKSIPLFFAISIISGCGHSDLESDPQKPQLVLFQFNGQRVYANICGETLLDKRVWTKEKWNAEGVSVVRNFNNTENCKIIISIEDAIISSENLKPGTRYIFLRYRFNKNYVDIVEECGESCLPYSIEQFSDLPPLD